MNLPLPMSPEDFLDSAVIPALEYLSKPLDTPKARVLLVAIALQESGLAHRWQVEPNGKGPARGLLQFEVGTPATRGGVTGVCMHHDTTELMRLLCRDRDVSFDPRAIWAQLENDDVLAVGVGRLMLLTDPNPLPEVGDEQGAWTYYDQVWRPGSPRPEAWPANYAAAMRAVR